jgi:alkaline phosphatase D
VIQATDDFNRADGIATGAPLDWRGPTGSTSSIASNRMVPTAGFPSLLIWTRDYNRKALGPDQYAQVKLWRPSNGNSIGVGIKSHENQSYSLSGFNRLRAQVDAVGAGDTIRIFRELNGTAGQLGSTYVVPGGVWADGSTLKIETIGTALTVYVDGVSVIATTESLFTGIAGASNFYATAASGAWDDLEIGVPTGVKNLVWGPLIGGPATNGAVKVGARASEAATLALEYGTDSTFATSTTTSGVAVTSATDFTTAFTLSGLTPSTTYYCRVLVDGTPKGYTPYGTFRTAPSPGAAGVYKFLVGSCIRQVFHDGICSTIAAKNCDAMIFNGDSIYADQSTWNVAATTLDQYRATYRDQLSPGRVTVNWSRLQSQIASYFMWDDHEYKDNGAGDLAVLQFVAAKAAWMEAHGGTTPDPIQAGELYYGVGYGNVGIFALDQRSHRGGGSILGATQLADFKAWALANNQTYPIKLFVTPVPSHSYATTGTDAWGGATYVAERDAFYAWIRANHIRGVVWIAGDQHQASYIKEVVAGVNYHTFQSSGLVNQTIPQTSTNPEIKWVFPPTTSYYGNTDSAHYGVVTIDTTVRPRTIRFDLYDRNGNAVTDALVPSTGGSTAGSVTLTEDDLNAGITVPPDAAYPVFGSPVFGGILSGVSP